MSFPLPTGLPLNIYDMQQSGQHTVLPVSLRTLDMGMFYNTVRIDFLRWSCYVFPALSPFACVAVEMKHPVILYFP